MKAPSVLPAMMPKVIKLVVLAAMVALVLFGTLQLTHSADINVVSPTPTSLRTIPATDVNPYGANFFLEREVEPWKVEKTLQMAKEAGIGWVKQQFPWEDIETSKGRYLDSNQHSTWEKYDQIVRLAEKYNLKLIVRIDRPPDWTRKDNSLRQAPPDDVNDYANFVRTVVSRYKGRIHYYQLWNEPNIYPEWGNQSVDPAAYVNLLRAGYQTAKAVDPDVYILSAPLAQTLEKSARNLSDVDYLDKMYQFGAKDYFDILFANAYGFDRPPEDPADINVLNFSRVALLRQVMEKNNDGKKPVWFNEFGWNASPDDMSKDKLTWGHVTEQQQADYTTKAIAMARSNWDWAGVFCIWYFRQDGHIRTDSSEYYFRMVDPGFTPRAIYNAVQKETRDLSAALRGSYQETNPAVEYRGNWQPKPDAEASGGAMMVSTKAEDNATITFRGTSLSLLVAKSPNAGMFNVSVDGHEAPQLPTDRQGRSYLDLFSDKPEWQVEVPIIAGLAPGEHTLRLVATKSSGGSGINCGVDGFIVGGDPSASGNALTVPLVVAAIVVIGGLGSLFWTRRRRHKRQKPNEQVS